MNDLIERLRSVQWGMVLDGDRAEDDPAAKCVFVDMRHDDFEALLNEAADALEAAREDAERYRWLRDKCDRWDGGLVVAEVTEFSLSSWSGDNLNAAIDQAMKEQA